LTRAYLGIDTQKFKPSSNLKQLRDKFNIPFDVIVIGSLGRLIPSKRVHDLLKAAALNREKRDAFVGFHQICDVYVLSSEREGLSTSLQEAMACGCTPVAENGVGCPEVVVDGYNGVLFETGNVEKLAEGILRASE